MVAHLKRLIAEGDPQLADDPNRRSRNWFSAEYAQVVRQSVILRCRGSGSGG